MEQVRDRGTDSDLGGRQAWKPEQHNNVSSGQANHALEYSGSPKIDTFCPCSKLEKCVNVWSLYVSL